jgi:hypothetical protein
MTGSHSLTLRARETERDGGEGGSHSSDGPVIHGKGEGPSRRAWEGRVPGQKGRAGSTQTGTVRSKPKLGFLRSLEYALEWCSSVYKSHHPSLLDFPSQKSIEVHLHEYQWVPAAVGYSAISGAAGI